MRGKLIGLGGLLLLGACGLNDNMAHVSASGVNGQRAFPAAGFDRVQAAGPFNLVVTVGGQPSVRAEGDTGLIEHLEVRVEDGQLQVGQQQGFDWSDTDGRVTVYVTAPALTGADLAGSGDLRVGPLQAQRFTASLAGSGNLSLARVQADAAQFRIAGSGNLDAAGSARETSIEIAGSGNAKLAALEAATASISIAGSGDADLRATGTADVRIVGSGNARVTGGARCNVSQLGSGEASCG